MTTQQSELDAVPIADRCFRGCATRAVVLDGFSAYCAKCSLAMLRAADNRLSTLAA